MLQRTTGPRASGLKETENENAIDEHFELDGQGRHDRDQRCPPGWPSAGSGRHPGPRHLMPARFGESSPFRGA